MSLKYSGGSHAAPSRGTFPKIIAVAVCVIIIFALGILCWVLPKKTFSEYENRDLAKMPEFSLESLFSGSFTSGIETAYADTFAFRDYFVKAASSLDSIKGISSSGTIYSGTSNDIEKPSEPETEITPVISTGTDAASESETDLQPVTQTDVNEPEDEPEEADDGIEGETVAGIFIYKGVAYELLGGSEETASYYASVINKYRANLSSDINLYSIVVPKHAEFGLPKKYRSLTKSAKDSINSIYSKYSSGITAVDAYSLLEEHKDEYIYFNTDHHWTGLGAYYGYSAFCSAAGITPRDYSSYTKHTIEHFLGTLYYDTLDKSLESNEDYVEWCEFPVESRVYDYNKGDMANYFESTVMASYASGRYSYGVFIGNDYPLTVIKTNVTNGRKLMIIKESYGNAFSTYAAAEFEETYIVDERYYPGNVLDLVNRAGITDVVIINNVSAANTNYHISNIEKLLTQNYSGDIILP